MQQALVSVKENLQELSLVPKYQVLLYYKYVQLSDPHEICQWQKDLCQQLNLRGRIIVATEGINGTVEGTVDNLRQYMQATKERTEFADIYFKATDGDGQAFPKLSVKVRKEIVSSYLNIDPRQITGKYLTAEELHQWFESGKEFYIVDMRNAYEAKVGRFENSLIFYNMNNFRDLPKVITDIESLKEKTIVTVCTGGVRCEKGSAFLITQGFRDVYQLKDGILEYMRKYPNKHFKGKLYTFDRRMLIGFETDSYEHEIVGRCDFCGIPCENYVNYEQAEGTRVQGIICPNCLSKNLVKLS